MIKIFAWCEKCHQNRSKGEMGSASFRLKFIIPTHSAPTLRPLCYHTPNLHLSKFASLCLALLAVHGSQQTFSVAWT